MVGRLNPNWIVPTAPRGTSDNRAASTAFVTGGSSGAGPRIVLNAATTFFIADNGNDANDGLASTRPWLTPAHAASVLFGNQYDFGGQTVTLQAVTGHAAFTTTFNLGGWVGGGSFIYDGAGGSINVSSGNAVNCSGNFAGSVTLQNATLVCSAAANGTLAGNDIYMGAIGKLNLGSGMAFDAANFFQMLVDTGGEIIVNADYTVPGNAPVHVGAFNLGVFRQVGHKVSWTGTRNFSSQFAYASRGGVLNIEGAPYLNAATGQRYSVDTGGIIYTGSGGNPNYFPGNAAGANDGTGVYA